MILMAHTEYFFEEQSSPLFIDFNLAKNRKQLPIIPLSLIKWILKHKVKHTVISLYLFNNKGEISGSLVQKLRFPISNNR